MKKMVRFCSIKTATASYTIIFRYSKFSLMTLNATNIKCSNLADKDDYGLRKLIKEKYRKDADPAVDIR